MKEYGRNGLQARLLQLNILAHDQAAVSSGGSQQPPPPPQRHQQQQQTRPRPGAAPDGDELLQLGTDAGQTAPTPRAPLIASIRVLPKQVHVNAVTQQVENIRLMFCPRDRRSVRIHVPVQLRGADVAPGAKAGGWLHTVHRTVPLRAAGWAIPPIIHLDVSHMQLKDYLRMSDVVLPPGTELAAPDPCHPVVRCAARVGGE